MKNGNGGEQFRREDVVFECFHNFVAFSQWGKTLFLIMSKLRRDGDPDVRRWLEHTMRGNFGAADQGSPFTPLERFVMELFRTISPNPGSISAIVENQTASG